MQQAKCRSDYVSRKVNLGGRDGLLLYIEKKTAYMYQEITYL